MKRGQLPDKAASGNGFSKYSVVNLSHPKYKEYIINIKKNKTKFGLNSPLLPYPDELKKAVAENKKKTALDT